MIVMTMLTDVAPAIEAEKLGAVTYIVKPIDFDAFVLHVERLRDEILETQELLHLRDQKSYQQIIGASPPMTSLFSVLRELAPIDVSTILITGESGTGNDIQWRCARARAVHRSRLCGVTVDLVRVDVVRPRARRLYRCQSDEARAV